jgi:hypothetical protein
MTATSDRRVIEGGCHCGTIRYRFELPDIGGTIPVRACSCSFCLKHGGVYTSHPKGRLDVEVTDASRVEPYQFGTKTAEFHICRTCGVVPMVTSDIAGTTYAVVNVNTFENIAPEELSSSPSDFDGETTDNRLTRRQRNWIGRVTIRTLS